MSSLSESVLAVLKELFPEIRIKTETFVKYNGQKLYLDIWIPQFDLAIEVHGRQHDVFVEHFHQTSKGFRDYKKRDRLKEEWAGINGITMLVIREKDFPLTKEKLLKMIVDRYDKR